MEAEILTMTGELFNVKGETYGCLTSGGTESICMAILAHRNWARESKGIT